MAYFGSYFGTVPATPEPAEPDAPEAIEVETANVAAKYVDHLAVALSRLPQYAKAKASE